MKLAINCSLARNYYPFFRGWKGYISKKQLWNWFGWTWCHEQCDAAPVGTRRLKKIGQRDHLESSHNDWTALVTSNDGCCWSLVVHNTKEKKVTIFFSQKNSRSLRHNFYLAKKPQLSISKAPWSRSGWPLSESLAKHLMCAENSSNCISEIQHLIQYQSRNQWKLGWWRYLEKLKIQKVNPSDFETLETYAF